MMPIDDDFSTCIETYATLRLFSDTVEPNEITKLLGIDPSRSFIKGESYGRSLVRKSNGWFLNTRNVVDSRDTRRHIEWLIAKVGGKAELLKDLQRRGVKMDICCYWLSVGQGGPILSPPQMTELATLNLDVWWDVYFSNTDNPMKLTIQARDSIHSNAGDTKK